MAHDLKAQEKVPVLARDGVTSLGYCAVAKFGKDPGKPLKEIVVTDTEGQPVAVITVFKLHSRVRCGDLEIEAKRIDTKHAAEVARVALEKKDDPREMLAAVQSEAEFLEVPQPA